MAKEQRRLNKITFAELKPVATSTAAPAQKPAKTVAKPSSNPAPESKSPSHFSDEYKDYMQSAEWRSKRHKRLVVDNFTCRTCARNKAELKAIGRWLEVHHTSKAYDYPLGTEPVELLISLCNKCHDGIDAPNRLESVEKTLNRRRKP